MNGVPATSSASPVFEMATSDSSRSKLKGASASLSARLPSGVSESADAVFTPCVPIGAPGSGSRLKTTVVVAPGARSANVQRRSLDEQVAVARRRHAVDGDVVHLEDEREGVAHGDPTGDRWSAVVHLDLEVEDLARARAGLVS